MPETAQGDTTSNLFLPTIQAVLEPSLGLSIPNCKGSSLGLAGDPITASWPLGSRSSALGLSSPEGRVSYGGGLLSQPGLLQPVAQEEVTWTDSSKWVRCLPHPHRGDMCLRRATASNVEVQACLPRHRRHSWKLSSFCCSAIRKKLHELGPAQPRRVPIHTQHNEAWHSGGHAPSSLSPWHFRPYAMPSFSENLQGFPQS